MTQRTATQLIPYAPLRGGGSRCVGLDGRRDADVCDVTRRSQFPCGGEQWSEVASRGTTCDAAAGGRHRSAPILRVLTVEQIREILRTEARSLVEEMVPQQLTERAAPDDPLVVAHDNAQRLAA